MTEKNKKDLKEIEKNKFYSNKTVNKLVTSAAIVALLAPSVSGVAAVSAEELTDDDPVEDVTDVPVPEVDEDVTSEEPIDEPGEDSGGETDDEPASDSNDVPLAPAVSSEEITDTGNVASGEVQTLNATADESTLAAPAQVESFTIGVEVRGLDGHRTEDVTVWVQNDDFTVFEGSFNEYGQWLTNEELPVGEYTITLDTPANTYAVINESTTNYAVPTDRQNVFTIEVNEDNLGSLSAVYGAFQLEELTAPIGVEVRGIDGRRTEDVTVWVQNDDFTVFEGSFNEYSQWLTNEELPVGEYTITLDTPANTYAVINESTTNYAVPTDRQNVFTIEVNEDNLGTMSAVYGAFQLNEMTFRLGVEVRGLDGRRTNDVWITVTNEHGDEFSGDYNEYLQWLTDDELPEGEYTITLDTPWGTVAEINDTTRQFAEATDEENVFTIELNDENLGYGSSIYGAFRLVELDTYQLGVEVRGLDGRRTNDVWITVTNEHGDEFSGDYNEYLQWLTDDELPEGEYTITLDTPAGTVAEINDSTNQYAVATDEENVFTIVLNDENLGYGSSIYGAFRLVEVPEEVETHRLGVEVRDLDNLRTDEVEIVVTNADGDVFEGSFNEYLQWLTEDELPVGVYTITLTTPEGTVAEINDTVATQAAEATDEDNVFTILVNEENRGSLSAVYGAFRLVEVDEEEQDNDDENGETPPVDEEDSNDDNGDTPDDDVEDDVDEDDVVDEDDEDVVVISDELPLTGIAGSSIGLGFASILAGLGLLTIKKKREDDEK